MYCSNCGKEVKDDAKFCKYCGAELAETNEASTESQDDEISEISPANSSSDGEKVAIPTDSIDTDSNQDTKAEEAIATAKPKKIKHRKMVEIEDSIALDRYTIKDDMVSSAPYLDTSRIELTHKGTLKGLKTKEIVLIVVASILLVLSAVFIALIRKNSTVNGETISALVVLGYFMFFLVFFAIAMGVDRIYNLLTLNELGARRITIKKYGMRLCPLALIDDEVYAIEISGQCDMCNGENKGTYHIEWQGDELIAVCNYDRHHLYKIDKDSILKSHDETSSD